MERECGRVRESGLPQVAQWRSERRGEQSSESAALIEQQQRSAQVATLLDLDLTGSPHGTGGSPESNHESPFIG